MTWSLNTDRLPPWLPWGRGFLPLAVGAFLIVRMGEALGHFPAWGRWYLDDLLCLPLVLSVVLVAHRLAGAGPRWCLPLSHGLLALALFGISFEILLPRVRPDAVADPVDLVMYAVGLALFQGLINRPVAVRAFPADHRA